MPKNRERQPTTDAVEIIRRRYLEGNPELQAEVDRCHAEYLVSEALYNLRTEAGLTQAELAGLAGTSASAINRMEDADYEGHSLAALRKIAKALGKRVVIGFLDEEPATSGVTEPAEDDSPRVAEAAA